MDNHSSGGTRFFQKAGRRQSESYFAPLYDPPMHWLLLCRLNRDATPQSTFFNFHVVFGKINAKQESIPTGCVPPACRSYPVVSQIPCPGRGVPPLGHTASQIIDIYNLFTYYPDIPIIGWRTPSGKYCIRHWPDLWLPSNLENSLKIIGHNKLYWFSHSHCHKLEIYLQ